MKVSYRHSFHLRLSYIHQRTCSIFHEYWKCVRREFDDIKWKIVTFEVVNWEILAVKWGRHAVSWMSVVRAVLSPQQLSSASHEPLGGSVGGPPPRLLPRPGQESQEMDGIPAVCTRWQLVRTSSRVPRLLHQAGNERDEERGNDDGDVGPGPQQNPPSLVTPPAVWKKPSCIQRGATQNALVIIM